MKLKNNFNKKKDKIISIKNRMKLDKNNYK
jgi:hypothetical protein